MPHATVVDFRNNLPDYLNRAQYGHERVTITRNGRPIAAVVSLEDLELLRALEDRLDLREAEVALREADDSGLLDWDAEKADANP
jgi:prevent-host-death family protein